MATAQVVSATTVLHEEKLEEKPVQTTEVDVKNAGDQEAIETAPQPQEDQLPKEPVDTTVEPVATEPDVAAPEPKAKPETETELEPEPEAVAADVENKMILEEEEDKIIPVDQPAKVAPEPCVEEEAKETEEPKAKPVETETEPAEVSKAEIETEPEEKLAQEKEGGTGTAGAADE
ncbi:hypothetical protein R6Q57_025795 [Mikania cordata]